MASIHRPAVRVICCFPTARPSVVRQGLLAYEQSEFRTHTWIDPADLAALPDRLEPPELPSRLPDVHSWR